MVVVRHGEGHILRSFYLATKLLELLPRHQTAGNNALCIWSNGVGIGGGRRETRYRRSVRTERIRRDGKRTLIRTKAKTKLYWIKISGLVFLKRDTPPYMHLFS
jgi:hypothetical protein